MRKMTSVGFQFPPGVFTVKDANPEQTLERVEEYVECGGYADGFQSEQKGQSHNRSQGGV